MFWYSTKSQIELLFQTLHSATPYPMNQSQKGSLLTPQIIYRTKPKLDKILATQPVLNSSPIFLIERVYNPRVIGIINDGVYGDMGFMGIWGYRQRVIVTPRVITTPGVIVTPVIIISPIITASPSDVVDPGKLC